MGSNQPGPADLSMFDGSYSSLGCYLREEGCVSSLGLGDADPSGRGGSGSQDFVAAGVCSSACSVSVDQDAQGSGWKRGRLTILRYRDKTLSITMFMHVNLRPQVRHLSLETSRVTPPQTAPLTGDQIFKH